MRRPPARPAGRLASSLQAGRHGHGRCGPLHERPLEGEHVRQTRSNIDFQHSRAPERPQLRFGAASPLLCVIGLAVQAVQEGRHKPMQAIARALTPELAQYSIVSPWSMFLGVAGCSLRERERCANLHRHAAYRHDWTPPPLFLNEGPYRLAHKGHTHLQRTVWRGRRDQRHKGHQVCSRNEGLWWWAAPGQTYPTTATQRRVQNRCATPPPNGRVASGPKAESGS